MNFSANDMKLRINNFPFSCENEKKIKNKIQFVAQLFATSYIRNWHILNAYSSIISWTCALIVIAVFCFLENPTKILFSCNVRMDRRGRTMCYIRRTYYGRYVHTRTHQLLILFNIYAHTFISLILNMVSVYEIAIFHTVHLYEIWWNRFYFINRRFFFLYFLFIVFLSWHTCLLLSTFYLYKYISLYIYVYKWIILKELRIQVQRNERIKLAKLCK